MQQQVRADHWEQQLKAAQERLAEVEQLLDVANADCADCDNVEALKERLAETERMVSEVDANPHACWFEWRKEYFAKHSPSSGKERG